MKRASCQSPSYTFKHVLTQEVTYQSLLRRTCQQYHARIAQVLEAQFPTVALAQPELLAQHYTEAGLQSRLSPTGSGQGSRPATARQTRKRPAPDHRPEATRQAACDCWCVPSRNSTYRLPWGQR